MIRAMPAAAPEHAPRPRLAPWLVAGAVIVAVAAGLAAAAWWGLPAVAPEWVVTHSPWADPVVRIAVSYEERNLGAGKTVLDTWLKNRYMQDAHASEHLLPYLSSGDHQARLVVVRALSQLQWMRRPPPLDKAMLLLLDDPDPLIRVHAVQAISEVSSIRALEAHGSDANAAVASVIESKIQELTEISKDHR